MKNPCCTPTNITVTTPQPDRRVEVCKVCGAKHVTLKADPGRFVAKGA